jgi:hypothetical protein
LTYFPENTAVKSSIRILVVSEDAQKECDRSSTVPIQETQRFFLIDVPLICICILFGSSSYAGDKCYFYL